MADVTVTAWFLIVLAVATAAGCLAFLLPVRHLSGAHPASDEITEPEHQARHRSTDDETTTRLDDFRPRRHER